MNDDLTSKSATELAQLITAREVSSAEVVKAYLRRIEQVNPDLNAIVTIASDVENRARAKDKELKDGKISGPLHGLPLTIKDTIDTQGIRTTYGSRVFARRVPEQDAAVVARLKAAGALILGKTNAPEMALPYETDNPVFGRTNNPHDPDRTCGGSSGGEAAALAAMLSPAGIGSDLSGSIRVPAHFCGVAGLKPTTGVLPMEGHVPRAAGALALGATVGPMARSVEDLKLLFRTLSGKPETEGLGALGRVAWFVDDGVAPVAEEIVSAVQRAADILRDGGLEVRQEAPAAFGQGQRLWIELFASVAAEEIGRLYEGHEEDAGPLVSTLLQRKSQTTREDKIQSAEALAKAVLERERCREELLKWMRTTPLIVSPVSATTAFEHGATRVNVRGKSISIFQSCSYSQAVNVFGLPAVALPIIRTAEGLPIGVQIIGRPFQEMQVMSAAGLIEKAAGFW
jgi:Asp-tRNA(Asn)/Glu-tRNA(Gln) amidotransferase A subunit family amidase